MGRGRLVNRKSLGCDLNQDLLMAFRVERSCTNDHPHSNYDPMSTPIPDTKCDRVILATLPADPRVSKIGAGFQ